VVGLVEGSVVTVVGFEVLMKVGSAERIVGLIFEGLALGELVGSIILGLRDDAVDVGL